MPPLVISDANFHEHQQERARRLAPDLPPLSFGCLPRRTVYGAYPHATPATQLINLIPRDEWATLIRHQQGNFLHDATKDFLPPHDQGQTNYCWAHGSVRTVEALRIYDGQTPFLLSAESVAVPVTGGENRGGYPEEALEQLVDFGACTQDFWPFNDRNIDHAVKGWRNNAELHRILQWVEVEGFPMQMTCALLRIPVAIGLRWWGHLVCQLDPILFEDGSFGIGCDNSWGADYGDNGYFLLTEARGTADLGAFAPLSDTFAQK